MRKHTPELVFVFKRCVINRCATTLFEEKNNLIGCKMRFLSLFTNKYIAKYHKYVPSWCIEHTKMRFGGTSSQLVLGFSFFTFFLYWVFRCTEIAVKPLPARGNACHFYVGIAQLEAHLFWEQGVGGSSPSAGTTEYGAYPLYLKPPPRHRVTSE